MRGAGRGLGRTDAGRARRGRGVHPVAREALAALEGDVARPATKRCVGLAGVLGRPCKAHAAAAAAEAAARGGRAVGFVPARSVMAGSGEGAVGVVLVWIMRRESWCSAAIPQTRKILPRCPSVRGQ